jgi:hypothetical protein
LETAIGGGRYVLLIINDATWHKDQYIVKSKLEALEKFKKWNTLRERKSGKQVKRFRTDGVGASASKKFAEYQKSDGILKETTSPYTPQDHRVVKRANRPIIELI